LLYGSALPPPESRAISADEECLEAAVPDRSDGKRPGGKDGDEGLSDLAKGYRGAAPYLAASTQLVAAVGVFTALGWWLDKKLGHEVPWLLMIGAVVGMTGGFLSFFRTVLGQKKNP
jgi:ATP synthase protein I